MDLGNALKRAGRDDITIRSVIANTIQEIYPRSVSISSVRISGKTILVKTGNPLVNSELNMMRGEIEESCIQKLKHIGISLDKESQIKFS